MSKKRKIEKNVVFWKDKTMIISSKILSVMKYNAVHNGTGKFRYCFHKNENSMIHEMLFTSIKGAYFRPHCHDEDELQVVISGKMYVIYFDGQGKVIESFLATKKNNCIYRINKGQWHMNFPVTNTVTIFEVKKGPFNTSSNHFPEWAPRIEERDKISKFLRKTKKAIRRMYI